MKKILSMLLLLSFVLVFATASVIAPNTEVIDDLNDDNSADDLNDDLNDDNSTDDLNDDNNRNSNNIVVPTPPKPVVTSSRTVVSPGPTGIAVGQVCDMSKEHNEEMMKLKREYVLKLESNEIEDAKELREKMNMLDNRIRQDRDACMSRTVPGLKNNTNARICAIPPELFDNLERARAKAAEFRKGNSTVPKDLMEKMDELQSKIAEHKARCNALNVTKEVHTEDVTNYYKQKLNEAMKTQDPETKLQSLKELRREIDETIKNMIEEKKELKFDDMKDMADNIRFRPGNVSIGDSSTKGKDFKLGFEFEGSNVTITPTDVAVILNHKGLNVTAEDITVDENGIYVEGVLVKSLPSAVFEHNKNLERNAERVISMKLEKSDDDRAVYNVEYKAKKRILGFIPANAKQTMIVDANGSQMISEKKPWWNAISTDVKEEPATETLTEPVTE